MFRITLTAAILCLVYGQTKYCCFPAQWTGQQGSTTGSSDDEGHTSISQGGAEVTYDVTGQRFYVNQNLQSGNESRSYQILQLYKDNVEYIIEGGRCTRVPLKAYDPVTNCVPDNATNNGGRFYLGRKQEMMVTEFKWNTAQLTILLTVNDDCLPVVSKTYGNVDGDNIIQGMGYLGITAGIKDPSVFNVPAICNGATEHQNHHRHTGVPLFLHSAVPSNDVKH